MNLNILGRAPSLASVTAADLLDGPVAAINGAVFHRPTPADYWVCCDAPHWCKEDPPNRPAVVTLGRNRHHWATRFPDLERVTYESEILAECVPWKTAVRWDAWSILLALYHGQAIGVQRVRFGGVSMEGDAYAYSTARVDTKLGPEKRWARERRDLALAMTELAEHAGIKFDYPHVARRYGCGQCGREYRMAYVFGAVSCANGECHGRLLGVLSESVMG